jgi:hypothetical protein
MITKRQLRHVLFTACTFCPHGELCTAYREAYDRHHDTPGRPLLALYGRPRGGSSPAALSGREPPVMSSKRVIKKYANRRLYDATASRHVTLDDLR